MSAPPSKAVRASAWRRNKLPFRITSKGDTWELVGEFTEVEGGRKTERPELAKALALYKKHKATLRIARLDRLARNVHFISGLMETK